MEVTLKWIKTENRLPEFNEEYLVVWNLHDGEKPVVTVMEFDLEEKVFIDSIGSGAAKGLSDILFWAELPKAPRMRKSTYIKH